MTVTDQGSEVVIRVRGDLDVDAATRVRLVVTDYVVHGGAVSDLVLDLRTTGRCWTQGLREIAPLIGAGVRLHTGSKRRMAPGVADSLRASQGGT